MATYGFAASFLKTVPEIQKLVTKATAEGYEMDKFLDALKVTKWWRSRSDAQKRYEIEARENPAQITASVDQAAKAIGRMAYTLGLNITWGVALSLGTQQVRNGLDEATIRGLLVSRYSRFNTTAGMAGRVRKDLTELAGSYGVKTTGKAVDDQIGAVLKGIRTVEDYQTFYRDMAKQQFKGIASQLDQGFTTRQILDPYIAAASQELGISASAVDISNGMWNAPANYVEKAGATPRAMTMDEWTKTIRTDTRYGFDKSQNGQRAASVLANSLMEAFGAKG
jgi:hypothetical protein